MDNKLITTRCGDLNVALCKSNPALIHEPKDDDTSDKLIDRIILAHILIAIPALCYSAPRFVEWVAGLVLRFV